MYSNSLNDDSMAKIATIVAQCKMIPTFPTVLQTEVDRYYNRI